MRIKKLSMQFIAAALAILVSGGLAASEVYRWVDEDGVVHFGDRAEGIPNAEVVDVPSKPSRRTDAPPPTTPADPQAEAENEPSYAQQRRDARAEARRKAAEERQQIEASCAVARERVAALEPSTKVLVEDEGGNVVRMDDDKRLELLAEAKAYVAKNCGS
ncbi:MAG: DUF4124 domain-containing protein [Lysobacterales bacterium]|jgi:hypothetical protein